MGKFNRERLLKATTKVFGVPTKLITEATRQGKVPECRMVIAHIGVNFGNMSDSEMGDFMCKDRSSVIVMRARCAELMSTDEEFRDKYYAIQDAGYLKGWL